ncbi:B-cell receptor CD22 [Ictalurus punctatus]|uniref:B-cell receptor CD22 n=1 Tax=Ictalurus punctatus TaxID=7998 RepID=A0A9F7R8U9_ICTPU|nr:B-cell receptor CD22 [Ictalurus punctatus]
MEFSPLAVMLLLISLIPVAHAQGSPKAVVSITPDTHVFIGETVTLRCDVQGGGDTQWTYSWYKNNNRLTDRTTQEFKIRSVLHVQHGVYTCRGQSSDSQSSEISDAVTLTVSEQPKPTVRVNPQSSVYTGDTITLTCELQSTGWEIQWYKNNPSLHPLSTEETDTLKVTDDNAGETVYQCRACRINYKPGHSYYCTQFSVPVNITVRERPGAVLSVSPQSWLTEGDSVTLSCEITDSSTDWTFSWYTAVPYRDGLTQIKDNHGYIMYVELLSDSSRGSGGKYTLSLADLKHTGVYMCRGERGEPAFHTQYSNPQPLWITGESPPVSLIINPSRTQHFTKDSLSLNCEDQSNSTGWRVRRYTHSEGGSDCSRGSVTGSTCEISFLSTSYTGVYWCESESGENSNPVNITVHDGDVILESPVHPVTEGHPLTLRCLYRYTKPPNLRADFYKDGSVLQTQTTGEMIIRTVSKSDEGFYHCKHPERGESPKSWVSVRGPSGVEAPFSVLMLISSVVTASPYLLVTIILLVKCYRARAHNGEYRIQNAVIEE